MPAAAIGADGTVLALGPDGRLQALPATLRRRQGDQVVIDVPPSLAGARVVAERAPQLGTGIRVEDAAGPPPAGRAEGEPPPGAGRG